MSENKESVRINAVAKELNVGVNTLVEHLVKSGYTVENKPTTKITGEMYQLLFDKFSSDKKAKDDANALKKPKTKKEDPVVVVAQITKKETPIIEDEDEGILIKTELAPPVQVAKPTLPIVKEEIIDEKPTEPEPQQETTGLKVLGKIDLDDLNPKKKKKKEEPAEKKAPKKSSKKEVQPVEELKVEQPIIEEKVEAITESPSIETEIDTKPEEIEEKIIEPNYEKLSGLKVMGKIELPVEQPKKPQPVASSDDSIGKKKRRRKNFVGGSDNLDIKKVEGNNPSNKGTTNGGINKNPRFGGNNNNPANKGQFNRGPKGRHHGNRPVEEEKKEITDKEIQDKLKATLARINNQQNIGQVRGKIRKQKRDAAADRREEEAMELEDQKKVKVTEFVSANELAQMMNIPVTNIISACMSLGLMVSINQRLDAETIAIVAEEFGYEVEFVTTDLIEEIEEEIDTEEDLQSRPPIVTVMGHVDHGKTSLLDHIRKANVIAGEAGGITQHIGAYEVKLANGKRVTFLDTPGHEAFTAMRARGAKLTDIVIIVIAADDSVMPQTKEAISHAQAAGVPIVFAINKIDREGANPDKIREQLAAIDILVEEWGGKYQCQEISAKKGINMDALLDKVLLEAEMLNLKANPNKRAVGSVIEATLDKGRGITATVMVQAGTLRVGDPILAGIHSGKVRAMFDERGRKLVTAGPSTPVVLLGFDGAPQAGDKFIVTKTEQEAKEIGNKRTQLQREQGIRTQKHITLDEIGRRLAIGNFKELKVIVKGDVDGSVEALSDSLIKLSTEEVAVDVIYKGVGQISESDVLLASASDAIIIGFQVRPSPQARKLAETESIDIRLYSIIYDAIAQIKDAMEGMLAPKEEEKITGNVEIREVFKISKVGTIAGCYVTEGKIFRNSKVRIIRDGVVVYTGELDSLKRFKDDVKEVGYGYECGLNIRNFNDIRVGDLVEAYEIVEVKRTLK